MTRYKFVFVFFSYYLYSISHPDKCGVPVINLSNDPESACGKLYVYNAG